MRGENLEFGIACVYLWRIPLPPPLYTWYLYRGLIGYIPSTLPPNLSHSGYCGGGGASDFEAAKMFEFPRTTLDWLHTFVLVDWIDIMSCELVFRNIPAINLFWWLWVPVFCFVFWYLLESNDCALLIVLPIYMCFHVSFFQGNTIHLTCNNLELTLLTPDKDLTCSSSLSGGVVNIQLDLFSVQNKAESDSFPSKDERYRL